MKKIEFENHIHGIAGLTIIVGIVLIIFVFFYWAYLATGDPGEGLLGAILLGGWQETLLLFAGCLTIAISLWFAYCLTAKVFQPKKEVNSDQRP